MQSESVNSPGGSRGGGLPVPDGRGQSQTVRHYFDLESGTARALYHPAVPVGGVEIT